MRPVSGVVVNFWGLALAGPGSDQGNLLPARPGSGQGKSLNKRIFD